MISDRRVRAREDKLEALGPPPSWWRVFARREWKRQRSIILAMDVTTYGEMLANMYPPETIEQLVHSRNLVLRFIRKASIRKASK